MSTMRAVQVVGYHQNLGWKEVPVPTPTGPFDVMVKIGGAGVCRTDLHVLEGQWAEKSQRFNFRTRSGTERRDGLKRSVRRSPTYAKATRSSCTR